MDSRPTPAATRRRGQALEVAIRDAVVFLLAQGGAARVTMAGVAQRAGTSKPVLYRRWPHREALLRETLLELVRSDVPTDDTGSYRSDMTAVLNGWSGLFTGPLAPVLHAIISSAEHDPELARAFREGVIGWRKSAMTELLERGIRRGDVRSDVPVDIARELGQAVLWHRFLVTGDTIDSELVHRVVDEVLVPFAAPQPGTD